MEFEEGDDFDFLEWLDKESKKTIKMRRAESTTLDNELIPWPEITSVQNDGFLEIKFATKVSYIPCRACQQASNKRILSSSETEEATSGEFWNQAEYKEYLMTNKHITVELVPSSVSNLDKLSFKWQIEDLQQDRIRIKLMFLYPELVSLYEDKDHVKISFSKTYLFMQDGKGGSTNILPSGYTLVSPLPRQKAVQSVLVEQKVTIEQSSQTVITAIPVFSFFFNLSMQQIWGSINSLQILAHLPIISFSIPSNVEQHFDILVAVVTFDLFGFFLEDWDFGQTKTEPYNEGLGTLSYDTVNILTNLFSIHVFVLYTLFSAIFCFIIRLSICRLPNWRLCFLCRRAQSAKLIDNFIMQALRIFLTGFLEILICSFIGLSIFRLPTAMTAVDLVAGVVDVIYLVCLVIFSITLIWFVFHRSKKLQRFKSARDKLEHLKILKIIYEKYKRAQPEDNSDREFDLKDMFQSVKISR